MASSWKTRSASRRSRTQAVQAKDRTLPASMPEGRSRASVVYSSATLLPCLPLPVTTIRRFATSVKPRGRTPGAFATSSPMVSDSPFLIGKVSKTSQSFRSPKPSGSSLDQRNLVRKIRAILVRQRMQCRSMECFCENHGRQSYSLRVLQ